MSRPSRTTAYEPTPSQTLLLRAGLLRDDRAIDAWNDWKCSNDLVETHHDAGSFRLLPLVYLNLVELDHHDDWTARLRGIYRYFWSSNQSLFHESAAVIDRLQRAGIESMILKGAAVSALYYRSPAIRPMSDVDVLVPWHVRREALECLAATGWHPSSRRLEDDLRYRHAVQMANDCGQEFDLHWCAFAECLGPDSDDGAWSRSVPVKLGGASTQAMGPEDALIHTVVHGVFVNRVAPIRWIADAATILAAEQRPINWALVTEEAGRRKVTVRLQAGLTFLRERFEIPVPSDVFVQRRAPVVERLEFQYMTMPREERKKLFFDSLPGIAVGCLRFVSGRGFFRSFLGLPDYLRFRLRLTGQSQIPVVLVRSVGNKLRELVARPV